MLKIKLRSLVPRWFKRKSRVTYITCPSCRRQEAGNSDRPQVEPTTSRHVPDLFFRQVAERAMSSAVAIDDRRRMMAGGDPLKDRLLGDIEAGYMRNVADIGRRLQRPDGQGDQP